MRISTAGRAAEHSHGYSDCAKELPIFCESDADSGSRTCSVFEYSKSEIFRADRGLSEANIKLCSRTSRFLMPNLW